MNKHLRSDENSPSYSQLGIQQRADNSIVGGGMQAAIGDDNIQIQGDSNVITFNKTEILQISVEEIKTRKFIQSSPYKGLKKFELEDKDLFFGRDQFIITLVNELEETNLILLLGASGSGKSSVVRAGLIPWLAQTYGTRLVNLMFTPDQDPFESFYATLLSKFPQKLAKIAREAKAETLTQVVNTLKTQPESFWFIFIDQFEELFTTSFPEKRELFIKSLVRLSKTNLPSVKIIATIRADFLDRLSPYSLLVKATDKHLKMIAEMQPDELRLAIEQPAAQHGVLFETGLVEEIIKDIQGQAGYLPLLQYTLNMLWETEVKNESIKNRTLNISTYRQLGGVRGTLQQRVDSIYGTLSPPEKLATQRIFLKLVGVGENLEFDTELKPVRRRALRSEFNSELERTVLVTLINENLLVSDHQLQSQESTIEIAHEILLTCWTTLNTWIKKNRQAIALRNRLNEDVARWQKNKIEDELWTGSKLEQVLELKKDLNFNQVLGGFSETASLFIDASVGLRDQQLRRVRIVAGVGLTLAALTTITSIFAFHQWERAETVQEGQIRALGGYSNSLIITNQYFNALIEAIRAAKQLKKQTVKPQTRNQIERVLKQALYGVSERNRLEGHKAAVKSVSFSPDGNTIATASFDKTIKLWNRDGTLIKTLTGYNAPISSVSFNPDGQIIASAGRDKTIKLWNRNGTLIKTLMGHKGDIDSVSFSPDGEIIASASEDATVKLWNRNGTLIKTLTGHNDAVRSVSFSPDGNIIASASRDKTVKLWTRNGTLIKTLTTHKRGVDSVSFSPDGKIIASASLDKTVKIWSREGQELYSLIGHDDEVWSANFSPDGNTIATTSRNKIVKLWTRDGKKIQTLAGHREGLFDVSFSPDGQIIATASADKTVKLWSYDSTELHTLIGHEDVVRSVSFSFDGQIIATASLDKTVKLWSRDGKLLHTLTGHTAPVYKVSFSPDSNIIASASLDKTVKLWSRDGKLLHTLIGHNDEVWSVSFSRDGNTIATASRDKTAKLWSRDGKLLHTLIGHSARVSSVIISPDGKTIATASEDKTAKLWSHDGKLLHTLIGHDDQVWSVSFSPDSNIIATASSDKTVKLWSRDGKELQTLTGHEYTVYSAIFSPDGKTLATASRDQTAILWFLDVKKLINLRYSNLDTLLVSACDWVSNYLKNNHTVSESDHQLCDGIRK
ncbi:MAG: hypothetical protein PUP91_15835 [Rhizonema sp. PD37]|nr:hypothetical protein [Rhizonema sp. PD37]